ncbi:hypothetical protein [Paraburkholderia sp. MM5384-R2]|uniref:hypothetical protein n=1 Tax=Paraburkholderia sp. MM5384-R2 TaxID=2723097 RepID=UPI0016201E65|nr:hypothetical protein [Paraburkholderia sp. MM5384-R2]MBB5498774.1 hypothetical protein [Paraburkholderia sp. MM5384-R2]
MIDREAGDKKKGDRFQKLRACIRLLSEIGLDRNNRIYCAIELLEDSLLIREQGDDAPCVEENKNYGSSLTFNSSPVRNTVVAFIDLDSRFLGNSPIRFSFYASATVGEERFDKSLFERAGLVSPGKSSILKKLCAKEPLSGDDVALCKASILDEYAKQYADIAGHGHLAAISAWTPEQFGQFLSKVEWIVTTDGNAELEDAAVDCVRKCPFYSHRHEGMESVIVGAICSEFERRSEHGVPMARLLGTPDIENIFLRTLGVQPQGKPLDPAHESWNEIDVTDMRSLQEKIEAVTASYPPKGLRRLKRRVGLAKDEARLWQREYVSLRRRVYDVCEDVLDANRHGRTSPLTPAEIDAILADMVTRSMEELTRLNKTYHYRIQDEITLRGAILSLFDECYLAFD